MMLRTGSSAPSRRCGAGLAVALLLLLSVEALLHSESFMHRLRSVFAVGRAYDKLLYVEAHPPELLVLGNSRVDNGIDPRTLVKPLGDGLNGFNLGLPGANATILLGIAERLAAGDRLGTGRIERVLIGLDEALLQGGDDLGYGVFLADRSLWEVGPAEFMRTHVHLWGYGANLKQLREPAKLQKFMQALVTELEPVGGGAAGRMGYRPGFGAAQDAEQVARQEVGSLAAPDPAVVRDFWTMVELLRAHSVEVSVVYPPLLSRRLLYQNPEQPQAEPYRHIAESLPARGVPVYALAPGEQFRATEFINAGHLNDAGAQRFSAMLGEALAGRSGTPHIDRLGPG